MKWYQQSAAVETPTAAALGDTTQGLEDPFGLPQSLLRLLTLDELGAITLGADIAAMKHETQHSRVFRT